jgi:DNA gyrase subunit B
MPRRSMSRAVSMRCRTRSSAAGKALRAKAPFSSPAWCVAALDAGLLASAEARKLDAAASSLQEAYAKPGILMRKGEEQPVSGPSDLFDAIMAIGRKGVTLQRYKGLGEMNADQLWETTLDRDVRSLLRVKVDQTAEADDMFVKLMGDVVEPRREFIQANALNATVDT